MKKLMIAGLVAAMAGVVMAGDCGMDCAFAYRMKLAGKTVKGKAIAAKSDCDTGACWAKPASFRMAGYIYSVSDKESECAECTCFAWDTLQTEGFWDETKAIIATEAPTVEVFDILRNGGLKNKAQICFSWTNLKLAGFGVYNPKTQALKSANGFFAGTINAPKCAGAYSEKTCTYGEDTDALVFKPCALNEAVAATAAIAYGRWSLTYRQDKVDALLAGAAPKAVLLPSGYTAK